MKNENQPNEIRSVVESIRPILAGKPPQIQGAALAELLALYLTGYWVPNNPLESQHLRDSVLEIHCTYVRQLAAVK